MRETESFQESPTFKKYTGRHGRNTPVIFLLNAVFGLSVTINTAILTADELDQINAIVDAAKARDAAMRSQQQSHNANESNLVS